MNITFSHVKPGQPGFSAFTPIQFRPSYSPPFLKPQCIIRRILKKNSLVLSESEFSKAKADL